MQLTSEQLTISAKLTVKMRELGISAVPVPPVSVGPILSVYRFVPQNSTKVSQLESLASDFAITLGVEDVMVKRLPGESSVAVFVPNAIRTPVKWLNIVSNITITSTIPDIRVPLILGVDHLGKIVVDDLSQLPHLLIAGSTGSGKSTLVSSLVASLMHYRSPHEIQFVLSDTKQVEFTHFIGAPHLLFPPCTSLFQTMERMEWLIEEMDTRLKTIAKAGQRNIHEFNSFFKNIAGAMQYPFIVFIIDELADILLDKQKQEGSRMSMGKIAADMLSKIVQKSRAVGVYVIASTQRPSVNVVEGSIKANFPARIAFRLPSDTDSRTVLNTGGAEHLLNQGDCLYISPNRPGITRLHAPFATIADMKAAFEFAIYRRELTDVQ